MTHTKLSYGLSTLLATLAVAACGGGDASNAPPQTAADQTVTTAGATGGGTNDNASTGSTGMNGTSGAAATMGSASNPNGGAGSPATTTPGTTPSSDTSQASASSASNADSSSLTDGQIASIIQAIDNGEIEQAHEALHKAKNAKVKEFARHMVSDHTAAETKLASVDQKASITPQTSAVCEQLKSGGEQIMTTLKSQSGADFDRAYIDAQVDEHTKGLDLLDNKLIPRASNPELAKTLQAIRGKVADHLKMAQDIQGSLSH
jgi:putative membrane protein